MHDQQPAVRPQHPIDLLDRRLVHAAERRPAADDRVDRRVLDRPGRIAWVDGRDASTLGRVPRELVGTAAKHEHVAACQRPEGLERSADLPLAVEGLPQPVGDLVGKGEREVRHGREYRFGPADGRSRFRSPHGTIVLVIEQIRAMPGAIRLFLVYALVILAGIGISLRSVIDLAIGAPVSGPGVVVMILLAYTIFTTTLVIQRKQASRALALGLASLTLPLLVYVLALGLVPQTLFLAALAALLFRGLLSAEARAWLSEE